MDRPYPPGVEQPSTEPVETASEQERGVHVGITVVKRNGERESYDANKINLAIEHASRGLDESITWVTQIASEL